jgi:signal transduction histidine kinase
LVILIVVALAAIPLTRAITRPLDRIADTARALGQGDLSARTGLNRRDEVGRLAQVLDEMAARLESTVKAEKELWANISHELRTPLSRIRVALELSAEEQEVDAVRRHLAGIDSDMAELERLLDDVLTSARLDLEGGGAGLVPRKEPLALEALCEEARRRLAERHPDRAVELSVAEGVQLEADRTLLLRVLGNLLENSVKYSEADTTVELAAGKQGEREVWVEVRDRGIGVDQADLPRLFEHFFRTDRSRTRGTGGTGLGLTLCRRIVEAHGGQIEAHARGGKERSDAARRSGATKDTAREGGGLTVRFTLPSSVHTS